MDGRGNTVTLYICYKAIWGCVEFKVEGLSICASILCVCVSVSVSMCNYVCLCRVCACDYVLCCQSSLARLFSFSA